MAKKVNFQEFLKNHNDNQKKLQELRDNKYKDNKKGGSKPSKFGMRMRYWKPDSNPVWVKFVPFTQEEPYYEYYMVWTKVNGKARSLIANSKAGQLEVPCVPYYYCIKDSNDALIPQRKDALTVNVLEYYHKVKKTSKKGTEYSAYELCKGVDRHNKSACEYCDEGLDKVYANQYFWSLGYGHKKQLEEQLDQIKLRCTSCKDGEISTWGYACGGCGEIIASHKEHDLSEEDVEMLETADDIQCEACGHVGKTIPQIECVHFEGHGSSGRWVAGCDDPKPVTNIWDLEFLIKTTGEGNSTALVIDGWRMPTEALKKWQLKPMDFDYFLAYQDLDDQAKAMGRENPFDESAQKVLEEYFGVGEEEEEEVEEYDE